MSTLWTCWLSLCGLLSYVVWRVHFYHIESPTKRPHSRAGKSGHLNAASLWEIGRNWRNRKYLHHKLLCVTHNENMKCECLCCVLLRSRMKPSHRSARTLRWGTPMPQLLTIHAVSKEARNPRAIPVPRGQKGCREQSMKIHCSTFS